MTARLTANIVERAVLFSENIMMRESMYKKKENLEYGIITVGRHFFDHSRYADRKGSTGFNSI